MELDSKLENKKNRRNFIIGGLKVVGACICAGSISSLIESCDSFEYDWEKSPTTLGITIELDITKDEVEFQFGKNVIKKVKIKDLGIEENFPGGLIYIPRVNMGIPLFIVDIEDPDKPFKEEEKFKKYACFSSLCTHDSCFGLQLFVDTYKIIHCNCHYSKFDATNHGKVKEGPAERALKQFPTRLNPETNILSIDF